MPTEKKNGLRYAIVFHDKAALALFDSTYWAKEFVKVSQLHDSVKIVDVETGDTIP